MPDTTERTLTFSSEYAPAQGFGLAAHLERNGKLAGESWVSRRDDSGSAPGTFTYKAAQNNYGATQGVRFGFQINTRSHTLIQIWNCHQFHLY